MAMAWFGVQILVRAGWLDAAAVQAWRTVCLAVTVQALPFLLLGTALSGAINAFVPERVFSRMLPKRPALAVPVAGLAGVVLPGCECASVPVANSLIGRGVTPAAAFTFLLSAPAINPVVLTATAIAFPGSPAMVLARLLASLTGFSPLARLAFMVVGPMVDLKLIALQAGTFGRPFAVRFSAATTVVAVLASVLIGGMLL
ncbi:permease [Streptomyces goshikiensis]|uniref:permease n=1 Tax=Streptomyces goshikiensis TaxID=1942 RepID=UPI0036881C4C